MRAQVSHSVIGVPVLHPVETEVIICLAVIFVRLCDHVYRQWLF